MIGTSEAETSTQRVSDILIDIASQFFLAVIVGLVMAVVANTFVEGARWFLNLSRVDSFISMQIGGAKYNLDIFLTLAGAAVLILLVRRTLGITIGPDPPTVFTRFNKAASRWISAWEWASTLAAFHCGKRRGFRRPVWSTGSLWRHHDRSSAEVHPDKNRPPSFHCLRRCWCHLRRLQRAHRRGAVCPRSAAAPYLYRRDRAHSRCIHRRLCGESGILRYRTHVLGP